VLELIKAGMLTAFGISGLLIMTMSTLMAVLMFLQFRKRLHALWGVFCLLVALWGWGGFQISLAITPEAALQWWKIAYVGVIFIPVVFTHFVHMFLRGKGCMLVCAMYVLSILYLLANLFTDWFIGGVHEMFSELYYLSPTVLYNSFVVLFFSLVAYAHVLLIRAYRAAREGRRKRIRYFFVATAIGFVGGSFSFLPVWGIDIYPYANLTVSFFPVIMGYAIVRHNLMEVRILATQLFVLLIWSVLLVRMVMAPGGVKGQVYDMALLLMTVIGGLFLVRSALKETKQRERIEKLNDRLKEANQHLKDLMTIKTEFLQIASHQLRTPLTSLRGLLEMQARGDFDEMDRGEQKGLRVKMLRSVNQLNNVVNDLLDAMELGGGNLNFKEEKVDIVSLISEAVESLKPSFSRKGLEVQIRVLDVIPLIKADKSYLRQVFLNLISNAEKYTVEGGLTVQISVKDGKVKLEFTDTGIGISKDEREKLFSKFARGRRSTLLHTDGSGLGLYAVKKVINGHHGEIRLESRGIDKGTTVTVELPLARN